MKAILVFECEIPPEAGCDAWCDGFHYALHSIQEALEKAATPGSMDDYADVFKEIKFE
jgi:hypothetical protein